MKFSVLATTVALVQTALAVQVSWDSMYDNDGQSLDTVACSDGDNGLETRFGFRTFSDVPTFPLIGGAQAVAGWNSASCGSCWTLTYQPSSSTSKTITIVAVDHADSGFNIGKEAMDQLTNGRADELGTADVTATQVAASQCGL